MRSLAIAIAAALLIAFAALAHAQYSHSFTTNVMVLTSEKSFSATGSITTYFIAYPRAVIAIGITNPGSSTASATVIVNCLNRPSATVSIPAKSTAYASLYLTIPSPPTSYIACPISVTPPNATSLKMVFFYPADVSLSYNSTHATYNIKLFTEPYFTIGTAMYYFDYFLTHLVYGAPPSGYSVTANINATLTTSYTDSAIRENSKIFNYYVFVLNITDTTPASGRSLGSVYVTMRLPRSVNLLVMPKLNPRVGPETIVTSKIVAVEVAEGQTLQLGILNASKVYSPAGAEYRWNFSIVRLDVVERGGLSPADVMTVVGGYRARIVGEGKAANGSVISVLALVRDVLASNVWYEPVVQRVAVITRPIVVNFTVPSPTNDVSRFKAISFAPLCALQRMSGARWTAGMLYVCPAESFRSVYPIADSVGEGIGIRAHPAGSDVSLHDYYLEVYYVATIDYAVVRYAFLNVTDPNAIRVMYYNARVVSGIPIVTGSLYGYYDRLTPRSRLAAFVPGAGADIMMSVTEVAPIRVGLTLTSSKALPSFVIYLLTDKKPNGADRQLRLPADIATKELVDDVYQLVIPMSYNNTMFTADVNALLEVYVQWRDGAPAAGVPVSVEGIGKFVTDRTGKVVIDPFYGTYTVSSWYVYKGVPYEDTKTVTLLDDTRVTLTIPIERPRPEVERVELMPPSGTVYANRTTTIGVRVVMNMPSEDDVMYSGLLHCRLTGREIVRAFGVQVLRGHTDGVTSVEVMFDRAGDWTCYAVVAGVASSTIVIKVEPFGAMAQLIESFGIIAWILIILAIVAICAGIAALIRHLAVRRRVEVIYPRE